MSDPQGNTAHTPKPDPVSRALRALLDALGYSPLEVAEITIEAHSVTVLAYQQDGEGRRLGERGELLMRSATHHYDTAALLAGAGR